MAYYSIMQSVPMHLEAVGVFAPSTGDPTEPVAPAIPPPGDIPVAPSPVGVAFDSGAVWADVTAMQAAYAAKNFGSANYLSRKVANRLRAVLAQLGYGDSPQNEVFGSAADCGAYGLFLTTAGRAPGYGMCGIAKDGFDALAEQNAAWKLTGIKPGPQPAVLYQEVDPVTFTPVPSGGTSPAIPVPPVGPVQPPAPSKPGTGTILGLTPGVFTAVAVAVVGLGIFGLSRRDLAPKQDRVPVRRISGRRAAARALPGLAARRF